MYKRPPVLRLAVAASLLSFAFACTGEDPWWLGTGEPDGKSDGSSLTIFLSKDQTNVRAILSTPELGDLSRGRTGILNVDGLSLSDDTMLIFDGELHRYDGKVDKHRAIYHPRFISAAEGAANPSGFLKLDYKQADSMREHVSGVDPLGVHAGVFRGMVVATNELTLEDELPEDLSGLFIRPGNAFQRPPNLINDAVVFFTPNVAITKLAPESSCFGDDIVDVTLANTGLNLEVAADGFPAGEDITVEIRYHIPHNAGGSFFEHVTDRVSGLFSGDTDEVVETVTISGGRGTTAATALTTLESGFFEEAFEMEIELRAVAGTNANIFADNYVHTLRVVDRGSMITVDAVELCPLGDDACRELRDRGAPDNVVARRNVIEFKAQGEGLYDTVTRPIGTCSGGDAVSGEFSNDCVAYREEQDSELSARVAAELEFELNVNGKAQGEASWGGSFNGIGAAEIEAEMKAEFALNVDLKASFETSRTWIDRHSLDVIYDPANTQIQWWRVVTPRIRYLEIAEFNECGARVVSNEVYMTDLRQSRLVLACEEVPSFDTVCHAVEPNEQTVNACDGLLIDPASPTGQMCLGE